MPYLDGGMGLEIEVQLCWMNDFGVHKRARRCIDLETIMSVKLRYAYV